MRTRLFCDADNTLWDTDAVFARAQLALARGVTSSSAAINRLDLTDDVTALMFVRQHDQRLASAHAAGLRYPVELLVAALNVAFGGLELPIRPQLIDDYRAATSAMPNLRPGVREALPSLVDRFGALTVVTESSAERCETVLAYHGLKGYVERVLVERKSAELYRALRSPQRHDVMVGDQIDRDIAYPQAAGFETVHFPGNFAPFWLRAVDVRPDHLIADFCELEPTLRRESNAGSQR